VQPQSPQLRTEQPSARPHESLSGLIERVTFFNEENGWAVLKVKAKGHRDLVAVVGSMPSVSAGEWVTAEGRWVQDKEFGLQFRADMLNSTAPTTKEGIEKYLGSGMVKGIGPVYARKLVEKFGERIFDIIEQESARLAERGVRKLLVICPAFVSDCLETLEEIGLRGRESFLAAGGTDFALIPCLNEHPLWLEVLERMVARFTTAGQNQAAQERALARNT